MRRLSLDEIFRIFSGVKMFDLYACLKGIQMCLKGDLKLNIKLKF